MYENLNYVFKEDIGKAIKAAMRVGDVEFAEMLLPRGRCLLDYAESCPQKDMIEWMLDCGYLRRDQELAAKAIQNLAAIGAVDLMKRITSELVTPTEMDMWKYNWRCAVMNACAAENIDAIEWLLGHSIASNSFRLKEDMVAYAAQLKNFKIANKICGRWGFSTTNGALRRAVYRGNATCVEILLRHFRYSFRHPDPKLIVEVAGLNRLAMLQCFHDWDLQQFDNDRRGMSWSIISQDAMDKAAASGYLDMVKWFHTNRTEGCSKEAMNAPATKGHLHVVRWLHEHSSEGCNADAMDGTATSGHLEVVKLLHFNRTEGCSAKAMDGAARGGHLQVVQWLHLNRSEGCTTKAMDSAATRGHLDEWLHVNRSERCTTNAMDLARDLKVVKWLHNNRSEGCTEASIERAIDIGCLGKAHWLNEHFPDYAPRKVDSGCFSRRLEVLLFLRVHYPEVLALEFREAVIYSLRRDLLSCTAHRYILEWLEANYELTDDDARATCPPSKIYTPDHELFRILVTNRVGGATPRFAKALAIPAKTVATKA